MKPSAVATKAPRKPKPAPPARPQPRVPPLRPINDRHVLESIFDAVEGMDVSATKAWIDLDSLSTHTTVDSVELVPEGVFLTPENGFAAVATVYVDLAFGSGEDSFSSADAVPAHVRGHFEANGKAVIDSLEVDTSSFYA